MRAYSVRLGEEALVYRHAYNGDVVAFKMGRRRNPACPFRRVFATCGTGAIRGSTSDDRVGCSASEGRCAPARPALYVSTRLLPFLSCALASADCLRPFPL